jgi:hypothetical protein
MRLDKSISHLVKLFNRIYKVFPASSCGGHKNPRGSQCELGYFWIILNIKNEEFLNELTSIVDVSNESSDYDMFELEQHLIYGTWCLIGETSNMHIIQDFVEKYISIKSNLKQESDWNKFYSYLSSTPTIL